MRKQRDVLDVEDGGARISGARLVIAICVTILALPLLVFGLPRSGSDRSSEAAGASSDLTSSRALPKGVSLAPTERSDRAVPTPDDTAPASASTASPPTTRAIAPTTTVPRSEDDDAETPPPPPEPDQTAESGQASWSDLPTGTCLHRTAAFDTVVRVTNTTTGASTTCTVTARGPYVAGRVIELERSVFAQIAPTNGGLVTVRVEW